MSALTVCILIILQLLYNSYCIKICRNIILETIIGFPLVSLPTKFYAHMLIMKRVRKLLVTDHHFELSNIPLRSIDLMICAYTNA